MALRNLSSALRQHAGAASRAGFCLLHVPVPAVAVARPLTCLASAGTVPPPTVSPAAPRDALAQWLPWGMRPFGTEAAPKVEPVRGAPFAHSANPSTHRSDGEADYLLMHPVYTEEWVHSIKPQHKIPEKFYEKAGFFAVSVMRRGFDLVTGYNEKDMNEKKWLRRIIFLETVAGVPGQHAPWFCGGQEQCDVACHVLAGMVGGMLRHMRSLRTMKRDHGRIHTLLEEAENERMHLLTFLQITKPGIFFRMMVLLTQGVFFNAFFLAYVVSPRVCHAFIGYLEEQAVITYTHALKDLDAGNLPEWEKLPCPDLAKKYWRLKDDAGMRELLLAVRADEAGHSHVNHTFSEIGVDDMNPFTTNRTEVAT